jgi:agmatine/peptidylarginine deiminase
VISHNETSEVNGLLVEWWCDDRRAADRWDRMWMKLIVEAAHRGAHAYVYLKSRYASENDPSSVDPERTRQVCGEKLLAYDRETNPSSSRPLDLASDVTFFYVTDFNDQDGFWTRDYGPLFVQRAGQRRLAVEDAVYYYGRPEDDAKPAAFARNYPIDWSEFPVYYQGGNFLPNGTGLCIAGSVLQEQNPGYSRQQLDAIFRADLGCQQLVIVESLDDDATGHVDMWMSWADSTTLIVGQYSAEQDRVNAAIVERNLERFLQHLRDPATGQPIRIVRMPMPSNCPTSDATAPDSCPGVGIGPRVWRSYLNAVPLNGAVLVPVYAQHRAVEAQALEVWRSLGFEPVPVPADHIISEDGALHCITKTIPVLR